MAKILAYKVFPEMLHEKFVLKFTPKEFSKIFAKNCPKFLYRIFFADFCMHVCAHCQWLLKPGIGQNRTLRNLPVINKKGPV